MAEVSDNKEAAEEWEAQKEEEGMRVEFPMSPRPSDREEAGESAFMKQVNEAEAKRKQAVSTVEVAGIIPHDPSPPPLLKAIRDGDVKAAKAIAEEDRQAALACVDRVNGRNALFYAVCFLKDNGLELVKYLVEEVGFNVNERTGLGFHVMQCVYHKEAEKLFYYLLDECGAEPDPSTPTLEEWRKRFKAHVADHVATAGELDREELTLKVAEVRKSWKLIYGLLEWWPLYRAAYAGQVQRVKHLVGLGCRVNRRKSSSGSSALAIAATSGREEVYMFLVEKGADELQCYVQPPGKTILMCAAEGGCVGIVEHVLEVYKNASAAGLNHSGAADEGAGEQEEDRPARRPSRSFGVDARIRTTFDSSLSLAAARGHVTVMHLLLREGADLFQKLKGGATPLYLATQNGHLAAVQYLLTRGANANDGLEYKDCQTALMTAAFGGHRKIVEELLKNGANPLLLSKSSHSAIDYATAGRHVAIVRQLKAFVSNPFKHNWQPDHEATVCPQCLMQFSLFKRRHHCRICGFVRCAACCPQKATHPLFPWKGAVMCCDDCFLILNPDDHLRLPDGTVDESKADVKPPKLHPPGFVWTYAIQKANSDLPLGWEAKHTSSGKEYFYDHNTGNKQWEKPEA